MTSALFCRENEYEQHILVMAGAFCIYFLRKKLHFIEELRQEYRIESNQINSRFGEPKGQ